MITSQRKLEVINIYLFNAEGDINAKELEYILDSLVWINDKIDAELTLSKVKSETLQGIRDEKLSEILSK